MCRRPPLRQLPSSATEPDTARLSPAWDVVRHGL
jgi:hypothetical protein